jgi:hypothetical protein
VSNEDSDQKNERDRYREAARTLYSNVTGSIMRLGHLPLELKITEHAGVHRVADGGAYVEAIVWVPESAVTRRKD